MTRFKNRLDRLEKKAPSAGYFLRTAIRPDGSGGKCYHVLDGIRREVTRAEYQAQALDEFQANPLPKPALSE